MVGVGFLVAVLLLYSGFSAPAPQTYGMVEVLMGAGLLLAIGPRHLLVVACGRQMYDPTANPVERIGTPVLWGLVILGTVRGGLAGWEAEDMLRDLIPLGFLFLPVFLGHTLRQAGNAGITALTLALTAAGGILTLRCWQDIDILMILGANSITLPALAGGSAPAGGSLVTDWQTLDYPLNSLTVLFAAIWLPLGWYQAGSGDRRTGLWLVSQPLRLLWLLLALTITALILAALTATLHRAALAAIGVGVGLGGWALMPSHYRLPTLLGAGLAGALVVVFEPDLIANHLAPLIGKTRQSGLNGRDQELTAVLDHSLTSPLSFLLGSGWGGLLTNPAVGNWRVSYVHNLPGYILFKGGIAGLLLLTIYAGAFVPAAQTVLRHQTVLAAALLPPLLVGIFLHTSFKYLCFGLLLTLLAASAEPTVAAFRPSKEHF